MKKILSILALFTLTLALASCGNKDKEAAQEVADSLLKDVNLDNLTNESPRIIFLDEVKEKNAKIEWTFNNPEYLGKNGKIFQPTTLEGDQTVTFSAKVTVGKESVTRNFEVVLKERELTLIVNEDFKSYQLGNFKNQGSEKGWANNEEKAGNTTFEIVDTAPAAIPGGSKALKIQAGTEAQMMLSLGNHRLKHLIVEFDVMQTAKNTTNSYTPLYIQDAQGGTTTNLGYGIKGNALYSRITGEEDNDTAGKANPLEVGSWYTVRANINLETKVLRLYQKKSTDAEFTQISVVQFSKDISYELMYFRAGSSTHTGDTLRGPLYLTNLKVGSATLFN